MKRALLFTCIILISISAYSQKLSKLGKIITHEIPTIPDFRVENLYGEYKIHTDSLVFEGNTYHEIQNGYITSLETADAKKDYIKHYDSKGQLIATILSDQIINLKISEKGNKLAFYNSGNIIQINLDNYKIDTLQGSFVFSYVGNEDLIYYNAENKTINFKANQIGINEYPNQIMDFRGDVMIVTKQNIYKLEGNSLFSKYLFKGRFFDAKVIGEEFYFVDLTEKRKSESFSLYKTSDFSRIMLIDRIDDLNR